MAVGVKWTDAGQAYAVDLLDLNTRAGAASTYFGAWGSGSTTPAVGDTTLQSENPEARTAIPAGSMSQPAADTVRWVYQIVATGTRTVQETGVLSAASGGILHVHAVHGSLALESGDSVTYTMNLRLKDDSEV